MKKTNAMRLLEQHEIAYKILTYETEDGLVDGVTVAQKVNKSVEEVFKTLVLQGSGRDYYVCMIPVEEHLSLKKVAKLVGEKKVEMIPTKDLLKITGYVRGGCSPLGMKKDFQTILHEDVEILDSIVFSAGKIGMQIEMLPDKLIALIGADVADICEAH